MIDITCVVIVMYCVVQDKWWLSRKCLVDLEVEREIKKYR